MRPLQLTVQAFGPFQQRETIDFTRFGDQPLFLINGATGSGKTTLLDAMCFALYGQTTGGEREARQMRSDHADGTLLAEVDFTFALGEHSYRVLRQPDQERPKLRGEGTTKQEARADFWRIEADGHETALSVQKVNTANQAIEEKIGLSAAQFRQVIVLPQGQFRQLLLAGSNEREAIFSRLFQTHAYREIETRLHEHASAIRKQADDLSKHQEGILSTVGLEDKKQLQEELKSLHNSHSEALQHKQQCDKQYQQATQQLNKGRELEQAFTKLVTAEKQFALLQQQQDVVDQQRKQLESAQQANKLLPTWQEQQRYQQALNKLRSEVRQHEKNWQQANTVLTQAAKSHQDAQVILQPKQQALQKQLIELESLRPHLEPLQTAQHTAADLKQQQAHASKQLSDLLKTIASTTSQRDEQQQKLQTLQAGQQEMPQLELALHQHKEQIKQLHQLQKLQANHEQLTQEQQAAKRQQQLLASQHQNLVSECKQLELAWHQGQAMLLARELNQDQPCPVCGSKQHPEPAHGDLFPPSQHTLEQARQTLVTVADELQQAKLIHEKINTRLQSTQQQLLELTHALQEANTNPDIVTAGITLADNGGLPASAENLCQRLTVLTQSEQQLTATLQQRKQETTALTVVEKALNEQQNILAQQQETQQSLQQAQQTTASALERALTETELLQQQLPPDYRTGQALEQAISSAQQTLVQQQKQLQQAEEHWRQQQQKAQEIAAQLKAAQAQTTQAEHALALASKNWQHALITSPFNDDAAFKAAQCNTGMQEQLTQHINQHTQALEQTTAILQERRSIIGEQNAPELAALETRQTTAKTKLNNAEQELQALSNRLHQLQEADKKHQQNSKTQATLNDRYKIAGTLADLANGRTHHRLSLQRFVLSVLLDDVLLAATSRFYQMSKGRYELQRKETRNKGNKAAGLDLMVTDTYTGKQREVATLSGGESFMAALSLALGLSDVIQGYAGGIRLDTLFIDEGFGSLDEESLELAIRTLTELRDSGRMVGIISHVAELKQQIPQRLDVISGRRGSRVALHCS